MTDEPKGEGLRPEDEAALAERGFEGAMDELDQLVTNLDEGALSLDQSIKSYERGMTLVRYCARELRRAEDRVKVLTEEAGRLRLTDFELETESE
jgi:exodeoxyribonuclease VII small subunit